MPEDAALGTRATAEGGGCLKEEKHSELGLCGQGALVNQTPLTGWN